jgi:hypothetical protein
MKAHETPLQTQFHFIFTVLVNCIARSLSLSPSLPPSLPYSPPHFEHDTLLAHDFVRPFLRISLNSEF